MSLPVECHRFREVRKDLKYTQAEFAQLLDLGQSTADIERGKTKISGKAVMLLQKLYGINPLWLFGESLEKHKHSICDAQNVSSWPRRTGKHHAGECTGCGGLSSKPWWSCWFDQQPLFNMPLPMFRGGYRGFEIEEDSMEPGFHGGDWVFGRAIDSLMDVKSKCLCSGSWFSAHQACR